MTRIAVPCHLHLPRLDPPERPHLVTATRAFAGQLVAHLSGRG